MPLRLGLLSTARINDAMLAAAREGDTATVTAVASRRADAATAYAHRHGIATPHGGYQSLLDDPAVDAVYISLPNSLHVEWTLRAIAAGKHVLCEKPLAWTGAEAERVVSAADAAGVALAEGFMYRHHPQTRELHELVGSGALGRVKLIRARFSFTAELPGDAVQLDAGLHGGSLLDVGCYCVSVSRLLAGEPSSVTAEMNVGPTGVDLRVRGRMWFADGTESQIEAALDLPDDSGVEVVGSERTAFVSDPWHCRSPGIMLADGGTITVTDADPYRLQLDDFAAAVREGRPPLVSGREIVGQARALEALIESARRGGEATEVETT